MKADLFFEQIKVNGDNFSYIVADEQSKEACVVDSSYNSHEVIQVIKNRKFKLKFIINTHSHIDHIADNEKLCSVFEALVVGYKLSNAETDVLVDDGQVLTIGTIPIEIIYTPGHTEDSICLLINDIKLLTGDTLFVGECGRTDLPGGSSASLYSSLFNKLMKLNENIEVYPGHDYGSKPFSTIQREKASNYTLKPRTLKEFKEFMSQP